MLGARAWLARFVAAMAALALMSCAHVPQHQPLELSVMTSGGFTAAYDALAPRYERASGDTLRVAYGASMGGAPDSIPQRLARGERADVVILAREGIDDLVRRGLVDPASVTDLVRSEIGMTVAIGSPRPDISTPQAFQAALLAAPRIGYSASASGTYLSTRLFPRLPIYQQIKSRLVRVESERVAAVVARHELDMGFQQVSEILPVRGAVLVGRIPAAYQLTTVFSAGVTTNSSRPADARRLIAFLSAPASAKVVAATGLDPIHH